MSSTETIAGIPFAPTRETLEAALSLLSAQGPGSGGAVDAGSRRAAFALYESLPVPGTRPSRGWRHDYTALRYDGLRWASERMTVATVPFARTAAPAESEPDRPALATENAGGLVHLGSTLLEPRDAARTDPRIRVSALADADWRTLCPPLLESLREATVTDKFAALAMAFQNCGAFVHVPDGVVLEAPVQLVFAGAEAGADAVFPHVYVVLGKNAKATIIERHVGDGQPLICGLVTAFVDDGAELDYVAVQQAGEEARLIVQRTARCERDARARFHLAELGGTLVRSVVHERLSESGAGAQTNALFFNTGMQHVDLTTTTDHAVGRTTSDTVVRSAAADRGQGRYFGNIVIRARSHGSDASLRDDALLLSRRAHIDSVPALEIAANDVKAFHGATVGSLDEDALFYAGSRGIPRAEAVRMVALAFFEPAIARFPGEALRDEIRTALDAKIDAATDVNA